MHNEDTKNRLLLLVSIEKVSNFLVMNICKAWGLSEFTAGNTIMIMLI